MISVLFFNQFVYTSDKIKYPKDSLSNNYKYKSNINSNNDKFPHNNNSKYNNIINNNLIESSNNCINSGTISRDNKNPQDSYSKSNNSMNSSNNIKIPHDNYSRHNDFINKSVLQINDTMSNKKLHYNKVPRNNHKNHSDTTIMKIINNEYETFPEDNEVKNTKNYFFKIDVNSSLTQQEIDKFCNNIKNKPALLKNIKYQLHTIHNKNFSTFNANDACYINIRNDLQNLFQEISHGTDITQICKKGNVINYKICYLVAKMLSNPDKNIHSINDINANNIIVDVANKIYQQVITRIVRGINLLQKLVVADNKLVDYIKANTITHNTDPKIIRLSNSGSNCWLAAFSQLLIALYNHEKLDNDPCIRNTNFYKFCNILRRKQFFNESVDYKCKINKESVKKNIGEIEYKKRSEEWDATQSSRKSMVSHPAGNNVLGKKSIDLIHELLLFFKERNEGNKDKSNNQEYAKTLTKLNIDKTDTNNSKLNNYKGILHSNAINKRTDKDILTNDEENQKRNQVLEMIGNYRNLDLGGSSYIALSLMLNIFPELKDFIGNEIEEQVINITENKIEKQSGNNNINKEKYKKEDKTEDQNTNNKINNKVNKQIKGSIGNTNMNNTNNQVTKQVIDNTDNKIEKQNKNNIYESEVKNEKDSENKLNNNNIDRLINTVNNLSFNFDQDYVEEEKNRLQKIINDDINRIKELEIKMKEKKEERQNCIEFGEFYDGELKDIDKIIEYISKGIENNKKWCKKFKRQKLDLNKNYLLQELNNNETYINNFTLSNNFKISSLESAKKISNKKYLIFDCGVNTSDLIDGYHYITKYNDDGNLEIYELIGITFGNNDHAVCFVKTGKSDSSWSGIDSSGSKNEDNLTLNDIIYDPNDLLKNNYLASDYENIYGSGSEEEKESKKQKPKLVLYKKISEDYFDNVFHQLNMQIFKNFVTWNCFINDDMRNDFNNANISNSVLISNMKEKLLYSYDQNKQNETFLVFFRKKQISKYDYDIVIKPVLENILYKNNKEVDEILLNKFYSMEYDSNYMVIKEDKLNNIVNFTRDYCSKNKIIDNNNTNELIKNLQNNNKITNVINSIKLKELTKNMENEERKEFVIKILKEKFSTNSSREQKSDINNASENNINKNSLGIDKEKINKNKTHKKLIINNKDDKNNILKSKTEEFNMKNIKENIDVNNSKKETDISNISKIFNNDLNLFKEYVENQDFRSIFLYSNIEDNFKESEISNEQIINDIKKELLSKLDSDDEESKYPYYSNAYNKKLNKSNRGIIKSILENKLYKNNKEIDKIILKKFYYDVIYNNNLYIGYSDILQIIKITIEQLIKNNNIKISNNINKIKNDNKSITNININNGENDVADNTKINNYINKLANNIVVDYRTKDIKHEDRKEFIKKKLKVKLMNDMNLRLI